MLPAMTGEYIEGKPRERSRAQPAGYLMQGADTFSLCEAHHHRAGDALKCVDLIAWDNL
jgi:hypothetical protein